MTNYNYYKASFYVQTVKRAKREGCQIDRRYGYVVRIYPPVPGTHFVGGEQKFISWCKTKAIAMASAARCRESQRLGYWSCQCGSMKQAKRCCGVKQSA